MILINAIRSQLKTLDQNDHNSIFRIRQTDKKIKEQTDERKRAKTRGRGADTKTQMANTGGK